MVEEQRMLTNSLLDLRKYPAERALLLYSRNPRSSVSAFYKIYMYRCNVPVPVHSYVAVDSSSS